MSTPPSSAVLWAIDTLPDGACRPVNDTWPGISPDDGNGYRWVHLNLGHDDTRKWITERLPADVAAAQLQSETRPRCDPLQDGVILNFRGVNFNTGADQDDMVSIRLWVTSSLIVTTELRRLKSIDELHEQCLASRTPQSPIHFVAELIKALTRKIETVSVELDDRTVQLEDMLEDTAVSDAELAYLRRKTAKLHRYTAPQSEALRQLLKADAGSVDRAALKTIAATTNQLVRTLEELSSIRDRLKIISDYKDALHAKRQSRHSNILSIVAAIFLPLGFVTGLFGVNIAGMPGTQWAGAFAALTLASIVTSIILLLLFRWFKWF